MALCDVLFNKLMYMNGFKSHMKPLKATACTLILHK